jgi:hypothetical protein
VAIDVSEAQLGASMRLLATGDRPRPIRPAGEVQKVAHLGNFCPLALFGPVGGTGRDPSVFWQRYEHGGHRPREVMADD